MDTLQDIQIIPVNSLLAPPRATPEVLGDLTSIQRDRGVAVVSHYNLRRVIDIYGSVQDGDLGTQYEHAIAVLTGKPPADLTLPAEPINQAPPSIPDIPRVMQEPYWNAVQILRRKSE